MLHPLARTERGLELKLGLRPGTGHCCHNGHPLWLYPFLSFCVFLNKSRIKKTDGHGYTWVWSYFFTPLSDLLMFSFFCVFSAVLNSNADSEITLVHLGHSVVEVVCLFVGLRV